MVFSCFYPNPGSVGVGPQDFAKVSTATAFLAEVTMTMVLLLAVFSLGDERILRPRKAISRRCSSD